MLSTIKQDRASRPDFIFIGEHPAVDFANTLVASGGQLVELLGSWADVVAWLSQAGLSADQSLPLPVARGAGALKNVIELRQAWQAALAQLVSGGRVTGTFLEHLNRLLAGDSFHELLQPGGPGGFHLIRSASRLNGEQLALALLARHIAGFLSAANLQQLHRCANTASCVLYFYDTTKNHRRQWCSVAACGNRHKVAAFRERQGKAGK